MKALRSIILVLLISTFFLASCDILTPTGETTPVLSQVDVDATVAAIVSGTQTAQVTEEDPQPISSEEPTEEATQEATDIPAPTPTPTQTPLLPQPLVFLTREGGQTFKLARFEQDGATLTYLTAAPEEIRSFAINPVDGSIAYIAPNNIYHMNADGSGKYILVAGVAPSVTDQYNYFDSFYGLAWSPDGQTLAFGRGGLNLYDMGSGMTTNLLVNTMALYGPEELYFPNMYSPDGTKLLVTIAWMEAGTLGVYKFSDSSFIQMLSGPIVGDVSWSLDSSKIYAASPYLGMFDSGFWEYNASTGVETVLFSDGAGTFYSPGWPIELANGEINFFMATSATMPEGYFDLYMTQSVGGDVTNRIVLNPTGHPVIDAAWTTNGVFAAIKLPGYSGGADPTPLKIISTDGTPIINVHPNATMPVWAP